MTKTYEAMFLLDAGNPDFESAAAPAREVLARAKAEILSLRPWDERRLCYEVSGRKRGLYVLAYFKADPAELQDLNHEIQLNERILRALVLSGDHLTEEQLKADTPMTAAAHRPPPILTPAPAPAATAAPAVPAAPAAAVPAEVPAAPPAPAAPAATEPPQP